MSAVKVAPLIIYAADGKHIAGFVRENIFRKELIGSKNMLHSPPGWTIEADVFDKLKRYGVTVIQVLDKETRKLYVVSRDTFERECLPVDRGTGPHKALALPYWKVTHD
jgi:hypothetical protein